MDNAFKTAPYGGCTTDYLKRVIAAGRGNPTMEGEVARRAKRDAGDTSVMTDGERLRYANSKRS